MKRKYVPCQIDNCHQNQIANGLCATHYQRKRRTGTTDNRIYQKEKICKADTCREHAEAIGYCRKHYGAYVRHGDPHVMIVSEPAKNKTCCILDCTNTQRAKGLCHNHYYRALYHIRQDSLKSHSDFIHQENTRIHTARNEVST